MTSDRVPSGDPWGDESEVVAAAVRWAAQRVLRPSDPTTTARSAAELAAAAGPTVTEGGIGGLEALRIFDRVLAPATRAQDDVMNLAYIPSAPTQVAVAFDLVTSAANIFGGLWESGAGAIFAENEALSWLVELLGWPETAGGCFVSGGTVGNLSALTAAREHAQRRRGGRPPGGWRLACSAEVHSSIRAAARVLDVGVMEVPVDDRGHLTGAALRRTLGEADDVCAVVASAGTTNAGVVDDLATVSDVCAERQLWLHVDGAYGGAALAAPSARDRFAGIERADSFIVDPHKWLFAPYDCCALVYRDPRLARQAHAQHAGYLDEIDRDESNPADLAVHLSRRARGLPFWFSLATHGTARYRAAIEQTLAITGEVAAAIRAAPHLRLVAEPELSVILFERPGWSEAQYREWSQRNARDGIVLCLPTRWQDRSVLRLAFVNPRTSPARVIEVLDTLR